MVLAVALRMPAATRRSPRPPRLQHGGREREHDAAPPRLLVGHHVGGDHRLAVAGPGRVEHAVQERKPRAAPTRRCRPPWRRARVAQPEVEFGLPGHDPAHNAFRRRRRRRGCGRTADAERRGLRERRIDQAAVSATATITAASFRPQRCHGAPSGSLACHRILLANWAPYWLDEVSELKNASPTCRPCAAGSLGRADASLHEAARP